jgi:PAS domain S-box-containing protein
MSPFRLSLVYAMACTAWIVLSDRALAALLAGGPAGLERAQTARGVTFVVASSTFLFFLLRRRQSEERVMREQVRAVLDGMADAILVVGQSRRIVDVNQAAVALLAAGHRRELLVDLDAFLARAQFRYPDGRPIPPEKSAARRALAGETVTADEVRMKRFDGRDLFVSVSSAPVRGAEGEEPRLAVAVLRDTSDVTRFEEAREEFFATAAHEFRTPLAVVKAYAQLMRKRGQGDPTALDTVARQIDRLTRMVEQLLEVSRFRLGGAVLRRERFDLAALLSDLAGTFRAQAGARRIIVSAEPLEVTADHERIEQVVSSLLDNAIRFSPGGGDVELSLTAQGSGVVVSVRDHGVGIPLERQARVFERYYRAHVDTPYDHGGLGLGLGVCREIVSRHGGRIWFESAPGAGSTFHFSLPLAAEGIKQAPAAAPVSVSPEARG